MRKVAGSVRSFLHGEEGATMVEYSIMVALIAAVCIGVITTIGTQIQAAFQNASTSIAAA